MNKSKYSEIAAEQNTLLKAMVKNMKQVFKDMSIGANKRHQVTGRQFRAGDAHRLDGLCFQTKRARDNKPDLAITILVDQSGSMIGPRSWAAQRAAILVYDFCQELDIPCMVCGHHMVNSRMMFEIHSDFRPLKDDNARIAAGVVNAGGCNRDGMAIQMANGYLEMRQEKVKLLLIISDGQPSDGDYRGDAAYKDMREIVDRAGRRGIHTLAFAIGQDKDRIKEIYGERYIDISDLTALPKKLSAVVRRYVRQSVD